MRQQHGWTEHEIASRDDQSEQRSGPCGPSAKQLENCVGRVPRRELAGQSMKAPPVQAPDRPRAEDAAGNAKPVRHITQETWINARTRGVVRATVKQRLV